MSSDPFPFLPSCLQVHGYSELRWENSPFKVSSLFLHRITDSLWIFLLKLVLFAGNLPAALYGSGSVGGNPPNLCFACLLSEGPWREQEGAHMLIHPTLKELLSYFPSYQLVSGPDPALRPTPGKTCHPWGPSLRLQLAVLCAKGGTPVGLKQPFNEPPAPQASAALTDPELALLSRHPLGEAVRSSSLAGLRSSWTWALCPGTGVPTCRGESGCRHVGRRP